MSPILTAPADSKVEKKEEDVLPEEIQVVRAFIGEVRTSRVNWEVHGFVNENMKQGNHYVNDKGKYDQRDERKLRRTVNKFRKGLQRLKNSVVFNDPIVDVIPERGKEQEVSQTEVDAASFLLLREWKLNDFQSKVKAAVETAGLKTWCLASIMPNDDDSDNEDRLTNIQIYDSFDVFFDNADMRVAQRLVISSLEDKERLKAKGYDVRKLPDAFDHSHSLSKTRLEQHRGRRMLTGKALIDQVFEIEYNEDEGKKTYKPESARVVHYVLAGDTAISKKKTLVYGEEEINNLSQIFKVLYLEEDLFNDYGTPWMSDVVPLQRSLNEASEDTDTILHASAKVRVLQRIGDRNNLQMFENKHMQTIEYDGTKPEFADMPNPPEGLFRMMAMREDQIERQIGQVTPRLEGEGSAKSGRHQALVMADNQDQVKDPSDQVAKWLEGIFEIVLDIAASNIDEVMEVSGDTGDDPLKLAVIGEDHFPNEVEGNPPVKIRRFKNIKVTVVPGSFFQLAQAKNDFMELMPIMAQMGFEIEGKAMWKVLMRMMNVGMSRDIARVIEQEGKKIELENSDWKIAEIEFLKMSNGEQVTATPEQDHMVHLQVKVPGLMQIRQKFGEDNDAYWILLQNIEQHYAMLQTQERGQNPSELPVELESEVQQGLIEEQQQTPQNATTALPAGGGV